MVGNPGRRAALVDAGVEVLARGGARQLTFRAVDAKAGVPAGPPPPTSPDAPTCCRQIDTRPHVRLAPDPDVVARLMTRPKDRSPVTAFMHDLVVEFRRTAGLPVATGPSPCCIWPCPG
jgi:hypothetical protein